LLPKGCELSNWHIITSRKKNLNFEIYLHLTLNQEKKKEK